MIHNNYVVNRQIGFTDNLTLRYQYRIELLDSVRLNNYRPRGDTVAHVAEAVIIQGAGAQPYKP